MSPDALNFVLRELQLLVVNGAVSLAFLENAYDALNF